MEAAYLAGEDELQSYIQVGVPTDIIQNWDNHELTRRCHLSYLDQKRYVSLRAETCQVGKRHANLPGQKPRKSFGHTVTIAEAQT